MVKELANKERPCDKKEADPQENMPAVAVETVSDATGPEIKEEPVSEIHSHNALGQDSVNPTENKTLSWNGNTHMCLHTRTGCMLTHVCTTHRQTSKHLIDEVLT